MGSVVELTPEEFDLHLDPILLHIQQESDQPGRYNPEYFYPAWRQLMRAGVARTWEAPGCVLGAVFFPDTISGALYGSVHFWWALPAVRGTGAPMRLFKAFEQAATAAGCKRVFSMAYETLNPNNLSAVYPRLGYKKHETIFSKEL